MLVLCIPIKRKNESQKYKAAHNDKLHQCTGTIHVFTKFYKNIYGIKAFFLYNALPFEKRSFNKSYFNYQQ